MVICVILLCGIAGDLPAQVFHRFGPTTQPGRLPPIIISTGQSSTKPNRVSEADISSAIQRHIDDERKKSTDKKFHVSYRGKDLALDLIKVHENPVSSLGASKYLGSADMRATDGIICDIDFFITGEPGSLNVTETSVHRINGKALYNWKEEGGVWKRVRIL